MKIAIASSGLGHTTRGIETWAWETAGALQRRGAAVELFHAGRSPLPGGPPGLKQHALGCLRRDDTPARALARDMPGRLWRWGLTSAYGLEQLSFWMSLWPRLVSGGFTVLHVQDPMVAFWCARFRRAGLVRTREILAHGTEEPPGFLARLDFVQHLAPWHLEQTLAALGHDAGWADGPGRLWTALPNFVDTGRFRPPADQEERARLRREFGIPEDALVVGAVAAVKRVHKRIDHLIGEAAAWLEGGAVPGQPPGFLVIAGAATGQTPELQAMLAKDISQHALMLLNLEHGRMPDLYRCLDVFVLTSLFEMMPIAVLEALSSGLPVVAHPHPVLKWMSGPPDSGASVDMAAPGALAAFLSGISPGWTDRTGQKARERALSMFGREAVVEEYLKLYARVAAK